MVDETKIVFKLACALAQARQYKYTPLYKYKCGGIGVFSFKQGYIKGVVRFKDRIVLQRFQKER